MQLVAAGRQVHQEVQRGGGEWRERRELRRQTSGKALISSDTTRGVMDGSPARLYR